MCIRDSPCAQRYAAAPFSHGPFSPFCFLPKSGCGSARAAPGQTIPLQRLSSFPESRQAALPAGVCQSACSGVYLKKDASGLTECIRSGLIKPRRVRPQGRYRRRHRSRCKMCIRDRMYPFSSHSRKIPGRTARKHRQKRRETRQAGAKQYKTVQDGAKLKES